MHCVINTICFGSCTITIPFVQGTDKRVVQVVWSPRHLTPQTTRINILRNIFTL